MKQARVVIEGTAPLLMNRFSEGLMGGEKKSITKEYNDKDEAEKRAYRNAAGNLCIPSEAIYGTMLKAATFYKAKRRSMSTILAGVLRVEPMLIDLGTKKYEIDVRSVVLKAGSAGKGTRILRARPRLDKWKATFTLIWNEKWVQANDLKDILAEAGERVGLLDGRPANKMWFGTFVIKEFKEL